MLHPPRRIALVCDWYHPRRGGIESHLDSLATRLAARGHSVMAITSTPGPSQVNGIPVRRLDVPRLPVAEVAVGRVSRAIERVLRAESIDIVHSHVSIVAPVALGAGAAAQRLRCPAVVTFHSFVPGTPLLAGVAGWLLGASNWRASMTAVSRRVAREVEAFAPGHTFALLPNAIDTSYWTAGPRSREDAEVRLVYAGRLSAKKRPLLLIEVLRELARSSTNEKWRLTIVGEGPLERRLRAAVRSMGLDRRVQFTGWVERGRLRELYRSSDIFLSTAARESFGLAALEARACGLPVVAVEDSAVSDFVTHEVSGLLANSNEEFAAATARLVRDAVLRGRIAEFNRRTQVSYDWQRAIEAHESAYASAAELIKP
jgi:glycosyltransferase involved in cell wall biosynthesis